VFRTPLQYLVLISVFVPGCTEEFNPDWSEYENLLVVEGFITNSPDFQYIKLSRTYPYVVSKGIRPETGAIVTVTKNSGEVFVCNETSEGTYRPDTSEFSPSSGESYQLFIELSDGQQYTSGFEMMQPSAHLDSIYYEIKKNDPINTGYSQDGLQLLVDVRTENTEGHLLWTFNETWEFTVPYGSGNEFRCWNHRASHSFITGSSSALIEPRIDRQRINFIPFSDNRLYIKYSMILNQFSISQEAFQFLGKLQKLSRQQGTIFSQTPYSLPGNVENLTNPKEQVLGYFFVAGHSNERIFINRSSLPDHLVISSGNEDCIASDSPNYDLSLTWYEIIRGNSVFFVNRMGCVKCSLTGEVSKPVFWPESE